MTMCCLPFTVSFDALETLIQITNGVGFQYRAAFSSFLKEHGVDLDASCPNATCAAMHEVALAAIRAEMKAERASWVTTDNPKEMPSGGKSDEELERFWGNILIKTFQCPSLYEGASPAVMDRIASLWTMEAAATRQFVHDVIFHRFGSTEAHSWLPEGVRTLQSLREWNQKRLQEVADAAKPASASSFSPKLVLAAPPFVLSNMDPRLRTVFYQLGALTPGEHGEPPLLSRVIVARDVGFAKPSPVGLQTGVRDIAAARRAEGISAEVEMCHHIHVGDAEADRLACERAGCVFVQCDPQIGVTWEQLHAALTKMEEARGN
jgi:hypothetical protein